MGSVSMPFLPPAYPKWPFIGLTAGVLAIAYGLLATVYWDAGFVLLLGTEITGALTAGASLYFLITLYRLRN